MKRRDSKGRLLKKGEYYYPARDVYEYRWQDASGKRRTLSAKTLDRLRDEEYVQSSGNDTISGSMTLAELCSSFLKMKQQTVREATFRSYDSVVRNNILPAPIASMCIEDIRKSHITAWVQGMYTAHGYGLSTLQLYARKLSNILQVAVDDEVLVRNPACGFDVWPVSAAKPSGHNIWTQAQQTAFADFIRGRWNSPLLLVTLRFGLRSGEVRGLRTDDADLERRVLHIRRQILRGGMAAPTKTPAGVRDIPWSDAGTTMLLRTAIAESNRRRQSDEPGWMFVSRHGKPYGASQLRSALDGYTRCYNKAHPEAPLPMLTAHELRHTAITTMIDSGVSPVVVAAVAGHSGAGITLNVYTHETTEHIQNALEDYSPGFSEGLSETKQKT